MLTEALPATELAASPPPWAVGATLVLIAVITTTLVMALPPSPEGGFTAVPPVSASQQR